MANSKAFKRLVRRVAKEKGWNYTRTMQWLREQRAEQEAEAAPKPDGWDSNVTTAPRPLRRVIVIAEGEP